MEKIDRRTPLLYVLYTCCILRFFKENIFAVVVVDSAVLVVVNKNVIFVMIASVTFTFLLYES